MLRIDIPPASQCDALWIEYRDEPAPKRPPIDGGANGSAALVPSDPAAQDARRKAVRENFRRRFASSADRFRTKLTELYGAEQGAKIRTAEAFEICEYGRQPNKEELRKLFPFFPPSQ